MVTTVPLPAGSFPQGVAITPDGAFAYVVHAPNIVSVIDTATNTVVASVPVASSGSGIAVTPNGVFVYVANTTNNSVSVISTATNTVVATVPVGINPAFIAFGTQGQDPIDSLIAQVEALSTAGTLTENQGAGLINKLEEVRAKRDSGQSSSACNQLNAFINQVNSLIKNHSLTQAQGQVLIEAVNTLKTNLGC